MPDDPTVSSFLITGIPDIPPPRRVVSLVPSVTESLFDLALGKYLVGITDYCVHPADRVVHLPRVGGTKNPRIEQVLELQPDLVIINREENRKEDAEALGAAQVNVWVTHPCSVQEAVNLLWDMMHVFDDPTMIERVHWIERQMDWTLNATSRQAHVRVFAPIWYHPWMTCAGGTYMNDLLRICGGENIFAAPDLFASETATTQHRPYPEVAIEQIVAGQPDVILLPDEPFPFGQEQVMTLASLDVPAAHHHRIHLVDGTLLTWHGTRLAHALNEIPPLLMPQE